MSSDFDYSTNDKKTCRIGGLNFYVKDLKCPKCGYEYSSDSQYVYELYLDMVAQSKMQGEPQYLNYIDFFKRESFCVQCSCHFIERVEFRKIYKGVWVTAHTYPREQDSRYIARTRK